MARMTLVFLLVLCSFLGCVLPFEFKDAGQEGVTFGDKISGVQPIELDEDNAGGRVKVVLISGVQGTLTINVNANNKELIDIQQETDSTDSSQVYLTANRLDYEMLRNGQYSTNYPMDILENNDISTRQVLAINIVNLDDESPTLSASACAMKENTAYDASSSNCKFTVSDPDGWLGTMNFSDIDGTSAERALFEFAYLDVPEDNVQSSDVFLVLKSGIRLDYEVKNLYSFQVHARDAAGHETISSSTVPIIVQVEDMPDQPPVWGSGFVTAKIITEKSPTTINVFATDGDVGINNKINYNITQSDIDDITVDAETGVISIGAINRDEGNDLVAFTIRAYETLDPDSYTEGEVTLIVSDLDDNPAVITVEGSEEKLVNIAISENSFDLNLTIIATDIDLGDNAVFNATLKFSGIDYSSGFTIIPGRGYERTNLVLSILDPSKLDFEDPDWRVINMELETIGIQTPDNVDSLPITITLTDINDEVPIFETTEYTAEVSESVTAGTLVQFIKATDRDAEDADLNHELLGNLAQTILNIEDVGGNVTTKIENAFDYEEQSEVIVQIRAIDKANHQATAQLTITVLDANDETPRIVVSSSITILENQEDGSFLNTNISASDQDSTANLEFSIDWTTSYATKNNVKVPQDSFDQFQCVTVTTLPHPDERTVSAQLTIKETQPGSTPDYEIFDTLYLNLVVTDLNQEVGSDTDSALIVISIEDVNDNAPVFPNDAETAKRQVTENADIGTFITSVVATDVDVKDVLTYSIEAADDDTPIEWVTIEPTTGTITVNSDTIDCDDPVRDSLKYNVTVTDGNHTSTVTISIDIIDTNDNAPTMDDIVTSLLEIENGDTSSNGFVIATLNPQDKDRDVEFHDVTCWMASTTGDEVTDRFTIDKNEIKLALADGVNLDREEQETFVFDLVCYDDPQQGPIANYIIPLPRVTITLEDINDNAPTITNTDIKGFNEGTTKGMTVTLQAEDKDAAETPNSEIDFLGITKIQRFLNKDDSSPQDDIPLDIFSIESSENNQGALTLNADNLEDCYGYLVLSINLTDKGNPPLSNSIDVSIEVAKFNFKEPTFLFPKDGQTFYLHSTQDANTALILFDGDRLDNITADDQQGGKFPIKFKIVEDSSDEQLFTVSNIENSSAAVLEVTTTEFIRKPYTVTIMAYIENDDDSIKGNAAFSTNVTINIDFFEEDTTDATLTDN